MQNIKYLFTGNRMNVLNEMVRLGLHVEILPPSKTKKKFIEEIKKRKFNVFVSNGCPFILPVSRIQKKNQLFLNVHPSLLPMFKGKSPILVAIKMGGPFGATCHIMSDEVDSGPIISQKMVFPNLTDANECYRLCFEAEGEVFRNAYKRGFKPL